MYRPSLDRLAEYELPDGFRIRSFEGGDEATWVAIHEVADLFAAVTLDHYRRSFGADQALLRDRQLFLTDPHGSNIGTASAWFDGTTPDTTLGRIHWVAMVPSYQGRGLAKPLLAQAMRRLVELGHRHAYLTTDTRRQVAITLYRRFGFEPITESELEVRRTAGPH